MTDVTLLVMVKCGDKNAEAKMKVLGLHPTQEGNYFQCRRNEHDKKKVENVHGQTIARF